MEWLNQYHKVRETTQKLEKRKIEQKLLNDLKQNHILEKETEIIKLKNRIEFLEKELESLKR